MRYYTKEYYTLLQTAGLSELFSPVIEKDVYTDSDIEEIYQQMLDKYIEEEREMFDEPPFFAVEFEEDITEAEFDPEDYIIGDITEEGEEVNLRHPASYEELVAYQAAERELELEEYENRGEFDEALAAEEFMENYRDNLEEPDEDVPEWVRESVDPRLLAMWAAPESIYRRICEEDEENQGRLDELDEAADAAFEDMYASIPDEYAELCDDLDMLDGDCVISMGTDGSDYIIELAGCDDDGEDVVRMVTLVDADVTEDEGFSIDVEEDEEGDIASDCDLLLHEVYYADGRFNAAFLIDNNGLKYLTMTCTDIQIEQTVSPEIVLQ